MDYFRAKRYLNTLQDWERDGTAAGSPEDYLPRMRALLRRMGNPQKDFASVIVGGTNGKGTVASVLAALLQACGRRTGIYSSPHLHTIRERIRIDGRILEKDEWAQWVSDLYDRTRGFEREGYGSYTRFEALTALAASTFAHAGVEIGVFEVGLGGRFDATNAWDAGVSVLTSIDLDHTEVLGDTVEAIALDKLEIARAGRPLFTPVTQKPEVLALLRRVCRERSVDLRIIGGETDGDCSRTWSQSPHQEVSDRGSVFRKNAGLAIGVGRHLLGKHLTDARIVEALTGLDLPGRFEMARRTPRVVLDGAHNPSGAAALLGDLGRMSKQWTFVVGVNAGHDAGGILEAIRPLARKVVLTRSDHPKALDVDTLRQSLPAGLSACCTRDIVEALGRAGLREGNPVCIMGSLHLIGRAREALGLPCERDGFGEDLHRESLACLAEACANLDVGIEPASKDGNLVCIRPPGRGPVYFLRNRHPFNDYVSARLAEDKAYQYELFTRAGLPVPETLVAFNPFADERFSRYRTHASIDAVVEDVERRFSYPVVVKRNTGSLAQGVFLEGDRCALEKRLRTLFENSGFLDNLILVQEHINGPEYRIVAARDELLLAYEKVSEAPNRDLNPLHGPAGIAKPVEAPELIEALSSLTARVSGVIELGFYAIDVIRSSAGFRVIEINPNPMCYFYNLHNGRSDFVGTYEKLISRYLQVSKTSVPSDGGPERIQESAQTENPERKRHGAHQCPTRTVPQRGLRRRRTDSR
ncbi:MAG: Mur ligase family protein [Gemmatimonadota bacterium]|nr:Mur ligase family protein [Gemmatimonadota bacterium]